MTADEQDAGTEKAGSAKRPKMDAVAASIRAHLLRFEADPKINKPNKPVDGLRPYFRPHAYRGGPWVMVSYVNYQGFRNLTRTEAEQYLAWLDAGNVGRHYAALLALEAR